MQYKYHASELKNDDLLRDIQSKKAEMERQQEELQAIQEEMHRKEKEYIERIEELENPEITGKRVK